MGANALVLDFIQDIGTEKTAQDVSASFQKLIGKFGFDYFCIGSIKPRSNDRGRVWASSLRHPWFRHWLDNGYISEDPALWYLKRSLRPFRWSFLRTQPDVPRREMFDEAAAFGIRDGWSTAFALGVPYAPAVAIGLGTPESRVNSHDDACLHLAALYCGLRFSQLELGVAAAACELSERERECLIWVAVGKTDCEISEIIGISHQTVHKHVSHALGKLGARTRAQAVAMAMAARQITP